MSYFMRFLATETPPTREEIASIVEAVEGLTATPEDEDLMVRDSNGALALLEFNVPGDGIFDEEIEELLEVVSDGKGDQDAVQAALKSTVALIAIEVLAGPRTPEDAMTALDPVLLALTDGTDGVLHADGEGFYRKTDLILDLS